MAQPTPHWPSFAVVAAHLTALSALAVTHPLLQLIARDPEFLVVHQVGGASVIAFVAFMLLLVPAVAIAVAWILRRLSLTASRFFVSLCVGGAAAALALQGLRDAPVIGNGVAALAAAGLVGLLAAVLYARTGLTRSFVTALTPAIIIVPAVFLLTTSVGRLLAEAPADGPVPVIETTTPIVVVVFDELPLASLLDSRYSIDAARYPSFAGLARDGTWFRNATTVATHTRWAMPAILAGVYPPAEAVPTASSYPNSVFTLFGATHQMNVFEPMTRLCPAVVCVENRGSAFRRAAAIANDMAIVYLHLVVPAPWTARLPAVDEDWGNFGNAGGAMSQRAGWLGLPEFDERRTRPLEFIDSIAAPESGPGFWFMHILLPHNPYVYLPSGQSYDEPRRADPGIQGGFWVQEPTVVGHVYQRHLLQVAYADRVLGLLVAKLKEIGVYDRALIAVLADHGVSFQPGDRRRSLTETNRADILSVPFIVKAPDATASQVIDGDVEVIDLLPTMAHMLRGHLPWPVDGRVAVNPGPRAQGRKVLSLPPGNRLMEDPTQYRIQALQWDNQFVTRAVQRKLELFEDGDPFRPRFPRHATLIGQSVAQFEIAQEPNVTVAVEDLARFDNVDLQGNFVPVRVHGTVAGEPSGSEPLTLAVAVNGTIWTTAGIAPDRSWSALVPPAALRNGVNDVQVFVVTSQGSAPRLARPAAPTDSR